MRKILLLGILLSSYGFSKNLDIDVSAKYAILMNAKNKIVLFDKRSKQKTYPASITKIATFLYAIQSKKVILEDVAEVSSDSLKTISAKEKKSINYSYPPHWSQPDAMMMGLRRGEKLSIRSLLYGLMLLSASDAANVIGERVSGNVENFMKDVNDYLVSIGCTDTYFNNPHGIFHPEHISTAYDIALMTRDALNIPFFREVIGSMSYQCPKTNKQRPRELTQFIKMVKPGSMFYPYAIGGKSGHVSKIGYNFSLAAEKDGRTLIAVVLGCENYNNGYLDVRRMFESAFSEKLRERKIFDKKQIFSIKVEGANDIIKASLLEDFMYLYFPAEDVKIKAVIHWENLHLPINKGQKIGQIKIFSKDDVQLQSMPIFAVNDTKETFVFKMSKFFKEKFSFKKAS